MKAYRIVWKNKLSGDKGASAACKDKKGVEKSLASLKKGHKDHADYICWIEEVELEEDNKKPPLPGVFEGVDKDGLFEALGENLDMFLDLECSGNGKLCEECSSSKDCTYKDLHRFFHNLKDDIAEVEKELTARGNFKEEAESKKEKVK